MRWPWQPDPDAPRRRAEALVETGLKQAEAGRIAKAAAAFERALEQVPSLLVARVNLGSACYQMALKARGEAKRQYLDRAREQFGYVLGIDPHNAAAALNLAATLDALGETDAAFEQLRRLAHNHPTRRDVWYNLALAHLRADRSNEARQAVLRELENHPDHRLASKLLAKLGESPPTDP